METTTDHCKLLNSYKKLLGQTVEYIHRMYLPCSTGNAHPTDWIPCEWDRPVKAIRELRVLDPDNLD